MTASVVTDTPPKPKCRRWRWPVVAVLLLMGIVIFRFSPRADQRFVGKWRITGLGSDRSDDGTITLQANGMGYWPFLTQYAFVESFPWVVRDDRFVRGGNARSEEWWMIRDLFSRVTNHVDDYATTDLDIHVVTEEYIFMRHPKTHEEFTLYRISD